MADAPTAPAAPTSSTTPSTQTAPAPASPKAAPAGKPRNNSGQFSPKEGAVGVAPKAETPKEAPAEAVKEAQAEARRLRAKLKVRGVEQEVDLSEEDAIREIQIGRANAAKVAELSRKLAEQESLLDPSKADVDALLRKLGKDPDEYAKTRLTSLLELEAMNEDQRARHEAEQRAAAAEAKLKAQEEAEAKVKLQLQTKQLRAARVEKYQKALAASGVPLETDEAKREMVYRMAQTEKALAGESDSHDWTPEELAKETVRRAKEDGKFYLSSLSIPVLVAELGTERMQALLEHTVAEFEKGAGVPVVTQRREEPEEEAPVAERQYLSETEADKKLKEYVARKKAR
jgi:NADH dehydrogenase [ubiquinone] 1 alpha subcomplex assembly factor 7